MTNDEREALIEKAAKAIRLAYAKEMYTGMGFESAAEAALAVFEQAHTPTDDERELRTLRTVVKDYDANFPCDGGCNVNDGPEETCSRHGRSPRDLWGRLDAALRRPVQGEPKHDDSCGEWCNHCTVCGDGILYGSRCREHYQNQPQGEPTPDAWRASIVDERSRQFTKGYGVDHDREHGVDHLLVWAQDYARRGEPLKSAALIEAARELLAVQRDPSRAELSAAIEAYKESARMHPGRTHMRAALRAAAAVTEQGGENRG